MAIEAGDAVWTISGDHSGLQNSLDGALGAVKHTTASVTQELATIGKGMTVAGAAMVAPLGLSLKAATDFGSALANVATLGVKDMEGLEASVRSVSVQYGQDLTASVKGAYQAISAGVSEMDAPLVLEQAAIAATAAQTDLTTAIELGTSMTNAFGIEMTNVSDVYDAAFVAVKAGVTTFEELAASAGKTAPAFSAAGLSADEMYAAVAALTKGGLGTAESFTALNAIITGFVRQGEIGTLQTLGLEGALQWLRETTAGNETEMLKFLGSTEAMSGALSLTGTQAGSFNTILGLMADKTGAAKEAFDIIAASDPAFAWNVLRASIQDLEITIGQGLIPAIKTISDVLIPAIQGVTNFMKENETLMVVLVTLIGTLGALMVAFGPLLMMLPGLKVLFQSVTSVSAVFAGTAGLGAVATGATAATGAIGGVAGAGLVGALGLLSAKLLLIAGAGMLLFEMFRSLQETKQATDELKDSTDRLAAAEDAYMQRVGNRVQEEKAASETLALAWYQYYAGRTASEQEFAQIQNLMLNKNISAQEAAAIVASNLSDKLKLELITANEEVTEEIMTAYGIREKAAQTNAQVVTQTMLDAAAEQRDGFVQAHTEAAERSSQVWETFFNVVRGWWETMAGFVINPLGTMMGTPTGLPGRAVGGPVTAGMPYIVGEKGPELFVPAQTGRIEPNTGGAWGGEVTLNVNIAEMNVRSENDIRRLSEELARQTRIELSNMGLSTL